MRFGRASYTVTGNPIKALQFCLKLWSLSTVVLTTNRPLPRYLFIIKEMYKVCLSNSSP